MNEIECEPIRGSVAQILNSREIVINRGSIHGVEIGMRFAILNKNGANIIDPETGDSLGSVDVEKTIMKVVRLQERIAVTRTFRTIYTPATGLSALTFPNSLVGRAARREFEKIQTSEDTYQEELSENDSYVKSGDKVVQVVGDEYLAD